MLHVYTKDDIAIVSNEPLTKSWFEDRALDISRFVPTKIEEKFVVISPKYIDHEEFTMEVVK